MYYRYENSDGHHNKYPVGQPVNYITATIRLGIDLYKFGGTLYQATYTFPNIYNLRRHVVLYFVLYLSRRFQSDLNAGSFQVSKAMKRFGRSI